MILIRGHVVHAHGYHAQCSRNEFGWTAAFAAVLAHVIHIAVKITSEPLAETQLRRGQVDIADTQLLESQLFAPANDVGFQHRQVLRRMIKWFWQYMFLVAAQYNRRHVYVAC